MAKKRTAKNGPRYLEFAPPRVLERPPGSTPADLVQALGAAVLTGELPPGWNVETGWRNNKNKPFKFEHIEQMIADSAARGGDFNGIFYNRYLRSKAKKYGVALRAPRVATPQEAEQFEEESEEIRERERPEFEALARQQKRATAARRGAAASKRLAGERKRSQAARKGWQTRRANAAKAQAKTKGRKKK